MEAKADVVIDLMARAIIAAHEAAHRAMGDAVMHAINAGEMLLQQKASMKHGEFGAWIKANLPFKEWTAQAYMRLAALPPEKRDSVTDLSLRAALRSLPAPESTKPRRRPKPKAAATAASATAATTATTSAPATAADAAPRSIGWTLAVELHLGTMPAGYSRNTLAQTPDKKTEIETELGRPIAARVMYPTDESLAIARAVRRCADRANPEAGIERAIAEYRDAITESRTLSETAQAKLERIIAKIRAALESRYWHDVNVEVAKQVEEKTRARAEYLRAREIKVELGERTLDQWMTESEFNIVRGCLHPDQPDRTPEQLRKAFQIFNRLRDRISSNVRARRERGWK